MRKIMKLKMQKQQVGEEDDEDIQDEQDGQDEQDIATLQISIIMTKWPYTYSTIQGLCLIIQCRETYFGH